MISISLFSLFLTIILAFNPPITQESFPWRRPIIGATFEVICVLGIIAVFFPKQCSATFHSKRERESSIGNLASHGNYPLLQGHHPDCEEYSAHVIRINNKTLCAACTGLLLGALIAMAGAALYFFSNWQIGHNPQTVFVGTLGVGFGLFQIKFRGAIRLLVNTSFVLGTFLILVGMDALTQSLLMDSFLIVLTVFWLFTRILLSQWDHWRTCYACKNPCEAREKKGEISIYGSARRGRQLEAILQI
jgi:hypothetical protein